MIIDRRYAGRVAVLFSIVIGFVAPALSCGSSSGMLKLADSSPRNSRDNTFVDMEALRQDPALRSVSESITDSLAPILLFLDLDAGGLSGVATFLVEGDKTLLLQASLDDEMLGERMSQLGYLFAISNGKQTWTGPIGTLALVEPNRVALAEQAESIEILLSDLREGRTLASNPHVGGLLKELPDGIVQSVTPQCGFVALGCTAVGISFIPDRSEAITRFTFIAIFDDEAAVERARPDLESFIRRGILYTTVVTEVNGPVFVASGNANAAEVFKDLAMEFDFFRQ